MPATYAYQKVVLDQMFGSGLTDIAPATWYIGLSTTLPSQDGTGVNEPSVGSYARVAVTNNATNFGPATSSDPIQTVNNTAVTFPEATANWGTVVAAVLFDAASGGNFRAYAQLDANQVVTSGNTPEFAAGALIWQPV